MYQLYFILFSSLLICTFHFTVLAQNQQEIRIASEEKTLLRNGLLKSASTEEFADRLWNIFQNLKDDQQRENFISRYFENNYSNDAFLNYLKINYRAEFLERLKLYCDENQDKPFFTLQYFKLQTNGYIQNYYAQLKKMRLANPENPMIAEVFVQAALESGDFEDAENVLNQFMDANPTDRMVEMLAECHLLAGRKDDALKLLNKTLSNRKNSDAILSDLVMLMRLDSPQNALAVLERQKEKLENKNAYTYYKAAGLLLSGKEKEAIPLLMQLASLKNFERISLPESITGRFGRQFFSAKDIKKLGPEFTAITCAKNLHSTQGSLRKEFFSREISNSDRRYFGIQREIRKRNDFAFAANSLCFLKMLAAEKPEFANEIIEFFQKDGQLFMAFYLPPLKNQPPKIRINELKKRFAEKKTDPICATLYFNEASVTPAVFTRPELEVLMEHMLRTNAPQLATLLKIIFDRNDFTQSEKESARTKILSAITRNFPLYFRIQNLARIEKNPAYEKFLMEERDKAFTQNKDNPAEKISYFLSQLDRDIKRQEYSQFARHLEQATTLYKEISFPEMIKELDKHDFEPVYTIFYTHPKRMTYLSEFAARIITYGSIFQTTAISQNSKNMLLPSSIEGTPPLFYMIKSVLSSTPQIIYTSTGRVTQFYDHSNARSRKQTDTKKLWAEIQKTSLKPMAKIQIAILAERNDDALKLLSQTLDGEKNPSLEFLFNALAFQLYLNQNEDAAKMIDRLLTRKDLSSDEKQLLSFFYLQLPEAEKDLKKCDALISALAAAAKTSADQQAFKTFLIKNKLAKQAAAIVFPKIKDSLTDISRTTYHYDNNEWNYYNQITAEYNKNKDAVLKRIKKTFSEETMRQRRILYLGQNPFYYRNSNSINAMSNTAQWGENQKTFEKILLDFQNSSDPMNNLVAAQLLDSVMKRPAEAAGIYEKLLEKKPDDLFLKQRICLLRAQNGPESAKKIFHNLNQDPLFELQSLLQRTKEITPEAAISLVTLTLDDAESQNKKMSLQEFDLLLSTLSRPYFSKDGKSDLKKLTRHSIYNDSDPANENEKLAGKRLELFNRLCRYGGKYQSLRWSAANARLNMILQKDLPPPQDLLTEFLELHKLGVISFPDANFAEFLSLRLIQNREFKEIRAFTSELEKKNAITANELNSYVDFTEKMLSVPENEFGKMYESAVRDSNLSLRVLQNSAMNAASERNIKDFDPTPVLLTKEMFTKQESAYPVIDYLNYAATHLPTDRIKTFIIRLYLFYFDNLSMAEQEAWSQSPYNYPGTMNIVMHPVGQYLAFNNSSKAPLTAGLFLAVMDPAMSKLPGKVRTMLFQRLQNSGFNMTPKIKLFDLLKQTPLFAGVPDFELPPMENGNMFTFMPRNITQSMCREIEAAKEKTFGMKMVRQLCTMWNNPEPLFPVLHEYEQEIKALPQEKRIRLWSSIDRIFSGHSNRLPLAAEKKLAQYPELKKLIAQDMKLISDKKYNDFMAIAILNPQNPYQDIQNARLLYQDFRNADPEKAERVLQRIIQLAKDDANSNSALKNYFAHLLDYKLIRLFKQNGITFENQKFNARTLISMFQKELNSVPQKERSAKIPDLFLEFATTFADKFNDNTVFAILFSSKPSDPAQLRMLAEGFRKRNASLPAFQTAQKLLNVMCEAAEKKITPESSAFLNQLLDNTLNKAPGAVEEQWLLRDPELFANSPRAVELFARAVKVLERRTGGNVVKDPAAYANLLFNLTRLKEQMQKEEFIKMAAPFFQNCYENLAVVENKHGELMLPCLIDFYTLANDEAKLEDLKEYTDLMTPNYFKKIDDGKKFPRNTIDSVKKLFPSLNKEK